MERIESTEGLRLLSSAAPERRSGIVTFAPASGDTRSLLRYLLDHRVICAHRGGGIRLSPHFYTGFDKLEHTMTLAREWLDRAAQPEG
jgi:selenocysteine lyase/cysteine desulfurase